MWSFLGSLLLQPQDRYIGISFTGVSISVLYLYASDRLKRASFLDSSKFQLASLGFFTSALSHALQLKAQWRRDFMQEKTMGGGKKQESGLPSQESVEQELHFYQQWIELYLVQSLQIDSKLSRRLYFSSKGKERDLNFSPSDPRVAGQE